MAIQIIPKPITKFPIFLNILFYLSLILLVATISSYFVLNNFQKKAEENLSALETELTRSKTPEEIALEEEVFGYQRKIKDFSYLISNHITNSNLLKLIENSSHPKVWFSEVTISSQDKKAKLSGLTDSFQILGQQFFIFKKESLIKEVDLSDISFGKEGKIEFTFNLLLDPKIFQK